MNALVGGKDKIMRKLNVFNQKIYSTSEIETRKIWFANRSYDSGFIKKQ